MAYDPTTLPNPDLTDPPGWILKPGKPPQRTGQWGLTQGPGDEQDYINQLNQQAKSVLGGLRNAAGIQ